MTGVRAGDRLAQLCCGFVIAAIVLGGGGSPSPTAELLVQLVAAGVGLAWWILARTSRRGSVKPEPVSRALLVLAAIMVAIPALQLLPLPPSVWQSLPGRETERLALTLIGREDSWRPLTLSPSRTLASLLALGPPLLAMLLVSRLDSVGRRKVIAVIAVMALVSAVLGVVQASGANGAFQLYDTGHRGWATGFFANRNATADLFMIGMLAVGIAAAGWASRLSRPVGFGAGVAATLVLVIATILTGSRAGISLLLLVVPLQAILLWGVLDMRAGRRTAVALAFLIMLALGAAYFLQENFVIGRSADRFQLGEDPRLELWADTRFAIGQFWPFGAGMGNFTPTLVAIERLEVVDPSWPNRAHNDYLEFAIEAGLLGLIAGSMAALMVLGLTVAGWRDRRTEHETILFAFGTCAIIGLHSLVDYPLRSMALAVMMGAAVGLLAPPPQSPAGRVRRGG